MKNLIFPLIVVLFLISVSCKKKLKVNADWEDITVIYGLLNPYDTAQYIKLNKCFLGEMSAYEMAQISDSLFYPTAEVKLIAGEIGSNSTFVSNGQEIILSESEMIEKEPGIFANDRNILFKTTENININTDYKLEIKIPGKDLITAFSSVLDLSKIQNKTFSSLNLKAEDADEINWNVVDDGKIYEITVRFHYMRVGPNGGYDREEKFVDLQLSQVTAKSAEAGANNELAAIISGSEFLNNLATEIKKDDDWESASRRVALQRPVELFFAVGSEDLSLYMEVNRPSNTINQERPSFTNVSNGLGLFTARSNVACVNFLRITDGTEDELGEGSITEGLKFATSNEADGYWSMYP